METTVDGIKKAYHRGGKREILPENHRKTERINGERMKELEEAWEKARSLPKKEARKGAFIGCLDKNGEKYYFYRDGKEYYYETEFDI